MGAVDIFSIYISVNPIEDHKKRKNYKKKSENKNINLKIMMFFWLKKLFYHKKDIILWFFHLFFTIYNFVSTIYVYRHHIKRHI